MPPYLPYLTIDIIWDNSSVLKVEFGSIPESWQLIQLLEKIFSPEDILILLELFSLQLIKKKRSTIRKNFFISHYSIAQNLTSS